MAKIGFIGLGTMGHGMAASIQKAGHELTVYNRTRSKTEEFSQRGAKVAATPAEAARGKEIVITMLADPTAVHEVVSGRNGVIMGLEKGAIYIDCSTVDPTTTAATQKAVTAEGASFLDCPVAGSRDAAEAGELILLVGGDQPVLDKVRPVLEAMGKKIVHAGPSGSGTALKLCFNLMIAHMVSALVEAMVLGVSGGLNPEMILDVIQSGKTASEYYDWKGNAIMDRDFSTNFSTRLMHKDLNLIMSAGYTFNTPLPITAAVKELYAMAKGHGEIDEDFCSVVKVLEDLADVEVRR